jgi:hypothetical protein
MVGHYNMAFQVVAEGWKMQVAGNYHLAMKVKNQQADALKISLP